MEGTVPRIKRTKGRGRHGLLKGGARPPEYSVWRALKQRCCNPDNCEYKNYGGRGINVCDRWLAADGFANFLADVGPQRFKGAGLRRLNDHGHFEPGNVEWGHTRGKLLTHDGRTMPLVEWAKELGIAACTLRGRLRRGLTVEAALVRYLVDLRYVRMTGPRSEGVPQTTQCPDEMKRTDKTSE